MTCVCVCVIKLLLTEPISFSATHLSSQCYTMCIRRESGFCSICYVTAITNTVNGDNAADTAAAQVRNCLVFSWGFNKATCSISIISSIH